MKLQYVLVLVGFVLFAAAQEHSAINKGHGSPIIIAGLPRPGSAHQKETPSPPIASGSAAPPPQPQPLPNLLDLAQRLNLSQFLTLVRTSDKALEQILEGQGPYTIFAPSDAAFAKLGQRNLNALLGDPMRLRQLLLYHIIAGRVLSTSLTDGQKLSTLSGEQLLVRISGGKIYINDALITSADNLASNGLIDIIDTVLIPPSFGSFFGSGSGSAVAPGVLIPRLLQQLGLNTFDSLLTPEVLGILNSTGPYTLFAPSESAFNKISRQTLEAIAADPIRLRQILLYHIVPGLYPTNLLTNGLLLATLEGQDLKITTSSTGQIRVNDALIVSPNHYASNGIVQIIDTLLIPPTGSGLPSVIGLAQELGLTSFLNAVIAADEGLYQSLNVNGPYTLFIPTNDAFTRFLATQGSSLTDLLSDPILLHQIMLYHILFGNFTEASFTPGTLPTLDDHERVTLSHDTAGWRVNGALITSPDHIASNGIIHIIDTVLIPPNLIPGSSGSSVAPLVPLLPLARQLSLDKFLALLALADPAIRDLLNGTGPFTLFVPADSAITLLGSGFVANRARLNELLLYWIVPGLYPSSSLTNGERLITAEGEPITISITNGKIYADNALITHSDNYATNGIIHILDTLIYPPSFSSSGSPGSSSALLPIPALARHLNLTTFADALTLTGLDSLLNGPGPYTAFAPNNQAFESLPPVVLTALRNNINIYRQILLYHILPGRFLSTTLTDGERLNTLQGSPVIFTRPAGTTNLHINNALVLTTDQLASNGLLNIINTLIIPVPLASDIGGLPPTPLPGAHAHM